MRRRDFLALAGGVAAWPLAARAQQPAMPVIGLLQFGSAAPLAHLVAGFRQGLGEAGFVEHRNVSIEYRWADARSDRLPELAADLVRLKVAAIVASPGQAARAAKSATKDIPIVFATGNDPVKAGLVDSLNRPGGNATGVHYFTTELTAKRFGLLRELVPTARRIAVLINRSGTEAGLTAAGEIAQREAQAAADTMGLALNILYANTNRETDAAFASIAQQRADALLIAPSPLFTSRRVQLVTLATRDRLPTIYPQREFAEIGGLMSYGANVADEYRKMGVYAGRILKGAKPADLPVEQSTKFEFIINLQTARALGIEVPPGLSARADEVIE